MMREPHKILVVDDEPDLEHLMLQRMRREIRRGHYAFVFAHNGAEALECLNQDKEIDMVLSDINMPVMDGLTLLEQIPSVDPNVRSVIVSAYGDMQNIRGAMNRGAFDFVTKPIDFDDLRITIERTLSHLALWREALESRDKLIVLKNELDLANKMQQSILPAEFHNGADYQMFGSMEPARDVGGDFFDVLSLPDGRIGIAVADVSGKGVPAALFMMSSYTLLRSVAFVRSGPGEVLRAVNNMLEENNEAAMFVTLFFGIFDPATGELDYANGGHNPPLMIRADGAAKLLPQPTGIALGVAPDFEFERSVTTLSPGDAVVLYTDGVTEAEDVGQDQFGVERLQEVFADSPPSDARKATMDVFQAVRAFAGEAPQFDDITCLTLYRGRPNE